MKYLRKRLLSDSKSEFEDDTEAAEAAEAAEIAETAESDRSQNSQHNSVVELRKQQQLSQLERENFQKI